MKGGWRLGRGLGLNEEDWSKRKKIGAKGRRLEQKKGDWSNIKGNCSNKKAKVRLFSVVADS